MNPANVCWHCIDLFVDGVQVNFNIPLDTK